ncbi:MAG: ROK family protein [bacterium]
MMKSKFYIGIDIGGTNIKSALVKDDKIIKRKKVLTYADQGPSAVVDQIIKAIQIFEKPLSHIGIGIAGIIDSRKGIVRYSPNLAGWSDVKLARLIKREFKVPVKILNDVNSICLGEWKFGAGRGYNNIFLFTLGTGVGGAAVCEGKLLFGANGFAGEFGHSVIKYDGKKCTCGQFGHLEGYVGARYIVERTKRRMRKQKSTLRKYKKITPYIIAQEAKRGDVLAKEIFAEIGFYIGIGLSNIISLFDPEVIIVSGGISRAGKILFDSIRKTADERIMGSVYRDFKIIPGKLGDDAGILGAVYFASSFSTRSTRSKNR